MRSSQELRGGVSRSGMLPESIKTQGDIMQYYCYDCQEWFEYEEDDFAEGRECPNCGGDLLDEDMYEEYRALAEDPYGDIGGPNGYWQDKEGNWNAR